MERLFWKKPLEDKDSFKLVCKSRHERRWLYFDLHFKKYLFMDRSGRKENQM